jgi:RNA polymerase sigma factor (sigma-70 family)
MIIMYVRYAHMEIVMMIVPTAVIKRDLCDENQLIAEYRNLIHYAIDRWYPYRPNIEYEDLFQIASIALFRAWQKYDPTRGASFATYALLHIKSAMYGEMRRNTAQKRRGVVISLFREFGDSQTRLIDLIADPATTAEYNIYQKEGRYNMANVRNSKTAADAPTVTKIDLSLFVVFNAANTLITRNTANIAVTKTGKVTMSAMVGKQFEFGEKIEVLLNQVGNIIVVRRSDIGIPCRKNGKDSEGKLVSCASAKLFLESKQVPLPVRYRAEWDTDLNAWVGRK